MSCVSSPYPCQWCKYRHVCTSQPHDCSFQEGRVRNPEVRWASCTRGPGSLQAGPWLCCPPSWGFLGASSTRGFSPQGCPEILPSGDLLIPVGVVQPLTLRAKNLPQPQSGQKNYECVVRVQGRHQRVPAVRFNSSSVQCQNASVRPTLPISGIRAVPSRLFGKPKLILAEDFLSLLLGIPELGLQGGGLHTFTRVTQVLLPQYSYEGDEYGDTELDFSVVWDGDFPIDKPATFRGELRDGAEDLTSWGSIGMSWGQGPAGGPFIRACNCSPVMPSVPTALLYKCWAQRPSCGLCLKADPRFNCGWCISEHRCQLRAHCPAPKTNWMHPNQKGARCSHPRIAQVGLPSTHCPLGTRQLSLPSRLPSCSADPPSHGAQGGGHLDHHRG